MTSDKISPETSHVRMLETNYFKLLSVLEWIENPVTKLYIECSRIFIITLCTNLTKPMVQMWQNTCFHLITILSMYGRIVFSRGTRALSVKQSFVPRKIF